MEWEKSAHGKMMNVVMICDQKHKERIDGFYHLKDVLPSQEEYVTFVLSFQRQ